MATRLDPGFAAAYYFRGLTRKMIADYDRAIDDFDRAVALDPSLVDAARTADEARRLRGKSR